MSQFCGNENNLVSVILPVGGYNEFFPEAVGSILTQSYQNIELLILANGVSDPDFRRISEIGSTDKRVKVYRLQLRGLAFALNFGVELAAGSLLARMDADDVSDKRRLELQVRFLIDNPGYSVVGGRIELIDEAGKSVNASYKFYQNSDDIRKVLPFRNPLCHPALLFRREAILNAGGYKFGFMSEDHELFIRMMLSGEKFFNLDERVLFYRRHSSQVTDISNSKRHFSEISAFMWMHFWNTKRISFLLGAAAIFPPVRKLRHLVTAIKARLDHKS